MNKCRRKQPAGWRDVNPSRREDGGMCPLDHFLPTYIPFQKKSIIRRLHSLRPLGREDKEKPCRDLPPTEKNHTHRHISAPACTNTEQPEVCYLYDFREPPYF